MLGVRVAALAALMAVAMPAPAPAYLLEDHSARWAEAAYYDDPEAVGAEIRFGAGGEDYYANVPPQVVAGKGGGGLCFAIQNNTTSRYARGCTDFGWELDPLVSGSATAVVTTEIRDADNEVVVAEEPFSIEVQLVGRGPIYPGAAVQLGPPDPYWSSDVGVSAGYTLLRGAEITGRITSPTLGTFEFTGRDARFGNERRETLLPLASGEG